MSTQARSLVAQHYNNRYNWDFVASINVIIQDLLENRPKGTTPHIFLSLILIVDGRHFQRMFLSATIFIIPTLFTGDTLFSLYTEALKAKKI